jgi:hypothetical protein
LLHPESNHVSKDLDIEVFGVPAADLPSLLAPFGR